MVAKVKGYFILAIIALISIAFASAFSVEPGSDVSMCAGTTSTIIDTVVDSGSYTITSSGSAAAFSTTIPSGMVDAGAVYSYVSPPTDALPGVYDLKVSIKNSGNELKEMAHKITVTDCHASALTVDSDKTSCTCEEAIFLLTLKNFGDYLESYDIFVEGPAKKFITLSDTVAIIGAGEEKAIKAYAKAPCDVYGKYELTFKANAQTSLSIASANANLEIMPCYEYSLETPSTYYSMCDSSKLTVPLTIKNTGTAGNKYDIKITAPEWAKLENNQLIISNSESAATNIILSPPYLISGNFSIKADITSSLGEVKKSHEFSVNVEKCYDAFVDIDKESDRLCNAVSNKYEVRVKNTGKYKNVYDLSVDGEFAKLSEERIELEANDEKALSLDVSPPYNAAAKKYSIKVTATDSISKASASDVIEVDIVTLEQCYQPAINAKSENVELAKDSTTTDLIVIENKGTDNATYIIDISGTASGFSEINPSILNIEPGKSEVVYIYIAPNILTNPGDYEAVVSARMKDTTILSSKTIKIKVNPAEEKKEAKDLTAEEEASAEAENITEIPQQGILEKIGQGFMKIGSALSSAGKWIGDTVAAGASGVKSFFSDIFSAKPEEKIPENMTVGELKEGFIAGAISEKQITDYLKSLNISDDSITLFIEKWKSESLENETQGIKTIVEVEIANATSNETETLSSENLTEENMTVSIENATAEEIPESESESLLIEIIGNETAAENITEAEIIIENQSQGEFNIEAPKLSLDFSAYKHYIIGAVIIILILLLFITGFWKKIIEFFEEEVEEPKNSKKK